MGRSRLDSALACANGNPAFRLRPRPTTRRRPARPRPSPPAQARRPRRAREEKPTPSLRHKMAARAAPNSARSAEGASLKRSDEKSRRRLAGPTAGSSPPPRRRPPRAPRSAGRPPPPTPLRRACHEPGLRVSVRAEPGGRAGQSVLRLAGGSLLPPRRPAPDCRAAPPLRREMEAAPRVTTAPRDAGAARRLAEAAAPPLPPERI